MAEWETIDVIGARGSRAGVGLADPWFLNSALRDSLQRGAMTIDVAPTDIVVSAPRPVPATGRLIEAGTEVGQAAWQLIRGLQPSLLPSAYVDLLNDLDTPAQRALDAAELAARRAEAAAIDVIPEVVVSGARFALPEVLVGAARILGGVPFGIATGILQGTYEAGRVLSGYALGNAIERLALPGIGGSGSPESPVLTPTFDYPDVILPDVTVSQPRPQTPRAPVPVPTFVQPFFDPFSSPYFDTPSGIPTPSAPTVAPPSPMLEPFSLSPPLDFPMSDPLTYAFPDGLPQPSAGGGPNLTGANPPSVDSSRPDRCPPCAKDKQKKRKEKKKQRERCFRGSYVESKTSLFKSPKEEIPCQSSSVKSLSASARRLASSTVRRTSSRGRAKSLQSGSLLRQLAAL